MNGRESESETIIRLIAPLPNNKKQARKPTKRPVGNKQSISFFQEAFNNSNEINSSWTFNSLQKLLSDSNEYLKKQDAESALKNQILFFSNLRASFKEQFLKYNNTRKISFQNQFLPHRRVKFENFSILPPIQPNDPTYFPQSLSLQSIFKPKKRTKNDGIEGPSHQMTSATIWNNTHKFFATEPTVTSLSKYLTLSTVPDINVKLGPHYSIAINEKLKAKFSKTPICALRFPSSMLENAEPTTSVLFPRLLASFVNASTEQSAESHTEPTVSHSKSADLEDDLDKLDSTSLTVKSSNENVQFDLADHDIMHSSSNHLITPSNIAGTNLYSCLPFEQKLLIEVQFIGLEPISNVPPMTDNEVMNDIIEKSNVLKEVIDETNQMRTKISEILKENEADLMKWEERSKRWAKYPSKRDNTPKQQNKLPKRDKLNSC